MKDYDDWIARLHALPDAFDQVTTNMSIGMEDQRVPPKYLLEKVLDQVKQLADAEAGGLAVGAAAQEISGLDCGRGAGAHQERDAGRDREGSAAGLHALCALPGGELRSGGTQRSRELSALPDGAKYYQFLHHAQTTTTDLTPDQIHQIGLDEVKKDEAEMLAIAQKLGFKDLASFRASLKTNPKLQPASARGAAGRVPRLSRADAGQAAAAVREAAQGAA